MFTPCYFVSVNSEHKERYCRARAKVRGIGKNLKSLNILLNVFQNELLKNRQQAGVARN